MRVLRPGRRGDLARHRARGAGGGAARTSRCTRSGARSRSPTSARERAILSLIGPRSVEIAGTRAAARARLRERARSAASSASPSAPRDGHRPDRRRRRRATRLREALLAAGAVEVAPEAAEILRIEAGRPASAPRWAPRRCPPRPGIVERAVSFTKGCYIGQETVARLHYKGKPNRHLRGLRLSAPAAAGSGRCASARRRSGRLGSAGVSPALGPIGLAILRREAEPGAELAVGEDGVTARGCRPALRLDSAAMGRGRARIGGVARLSALAALAGVGCGESQPRQRAAAAGADPGQRHDHPKDVIVAADRDRRSARKRPSRSRRTRTLRSRR